MTLRSLFSKAHFFVISLCQLGTVSKLIQGVYTQTDSPEAALTRPAYVSARVTMLWLQKNQNY